MDLESTLVDRLKLMPNETLARGLEAMGKDTYDPNDPIELVASLTLKEAARRIRINANQDDDK